MIVTLLFFGVPVLLGGGIMSKIEEIELQERMNKIKTRRREIREWREYLEYQDIMAAIRSRRRGSTGSIPNPKSINKECQRSWEW